MHGMLKFDFIRKENIMKRKGILEKKYEAIHKKWLAPLKYLVIAIYFVFVPSY
jgi:hypothetical protein